MPEKIVQLRRQLGLDGTPIWEVEWRKGVAPGQLSYSELLFPKI